MDDGKQTAGQPHGGKRQHLQLLIQILRDLLLTVKLQGVNGPGEDRGKSLPHHAARKFQQRRRHNLPYTRVQLLTRIGGNDGLACAAAAGDTGGRGLAWVMHVLPSASRSASRGVTTVVLPAPMMSWWHSESPEECAAMKRRTSAT